MKPIPNPIVVNTGKEDRVSKTIDDFFLETKEFVQENYCVQKPNFMIKSRELAPKK